jgi:hypothetical protein
MKEVLPTITKKCHLLSYLRNSKDSATYVENMVTGKKTVRKIKASKTINQTIDTVAY